MDGDREIRLRYSGTCVQCGEVIPQGARAIHSSAARSVRHMVCGVELDRGVAGASARREHERRRAKDDAQIAEQKANIQKVLGTGFLGRVAAVLAVDDRPRRSTEVWAQGAVGEEVVAVAIDRLAEVGVVALHDRRIPGSRANIDHIAITPWGVWVIDAKHSPRKRPDMITEGGFLGVGGTTRLTVGGRKKDQFVGGVLRQVGRVRAAVDDEISVRGALAFVEADWPLLGGDFTVREVAVVWPGRLAKLLLQREPPTVDVEALSRRIASHFPPA